MGKEIYWVYILECNNGHYYTGYTTDMQRRYQEHLLGTDKCKYTRSFKPVAIAQCWQVDESKSTALKMEKYVKSISKQQKIQLITNPQILTQLFNCRILENKD